MQRQRVRADSTVGIFLYTSGQFGPEHCTISNNIVTANDNDGIVLYKSSNNTLTGNIVTANGDTGIVLSTRSNNNTLTDNIVTANAGNGIVIQWGNYINMTNNTMSGNRYNFALGGSSLPRLTHFIDTSNTVEGKPIYYWVDQHDNVIPSDAGFVGVVNSTNITVRDLVLTNNGRAVLFGYTNKSRIENITANANYWGIFLVSSNGNTLTNNVISESTYRGICMYSSDNNTITNNTANENGETGNRLLEGGIWLEGSSDNLIYNNYFDNVINAQDDGNNVWNTTLRAGTNIVGGPNIGGNYWSDYTGIDKNGDKIGDTLLPYNSSGTIQNGGDWLPLANLPVHNLDSDESFATIQQAIDANSTTTDHHIEVDPGTYTENVNVYKSVWLCSTSGDAADTIVEAADPDDHVFEVTAGDVHIQELTVKNAVSPGSAGVYLADGTAHCTVSYIQFTNNDCGVRLDNAHDNTILYTDGSGNNYSIYMLNSDNNVISSNRASSNHKNGIFISSSDNITLIYNTALWNNNSGILLSGVNDSYIYYNLADANSYDGIRLFNSHDNTISTNSVTMNKENGMKLGSSSENTITGNTFDANTYNGIYLDEKSEGTIIHFNNILGNGNYGVYNNNTGETVNAESNWWGAASGPGGAVSSYVDYDPWLGGKSHTEEVIDDTIDAKTEADTEVEVDGTATVTVAKYAGNPAGNPPGGFSTAGDYIDVYVGDASGVTEIEIRNYYTDAGIAGLDESSLRLRYWNGAAWVACSNSNVNPAATGGYSGYVWAIINGTTTPDLAYLQGGVFGAMGPEEEDEEDEEDEGGIRGSGGTPRDSDGDGYSDIDEMLAETNPNDPCDPNPDCAACLAIRPPTPTPTQTPPPTATPTSEPPETPQPAATPTPIEQEEGENQPIPGFGAVFALAGLFVVAYLVRRRRNGN